MGYLFVMRGRRGQRGKRFRTWDRNQSSNKRSSRVLYHSSWLDDPWNALEHPEKNNNRCRVFYDSSWLSDPWSSLSSTGSVRYYDSSWLEDPWKSMESE